MADQECLLAYNFDVTADRLAMRVTLSSNRHPLVCLDQISVSFPSNTLVLNLILSRVTSCVLLCNFNSFRNFLCVTKLTATKHLVPLPFLTSK